MQSVLKNHSSDEFNLIRLCFSTFGLKIDNFLNAILREDVMVALDALIKPKSFEQRAQTVKGNIRV